MKDILVKRKRRKIDYKRIIDCLGLNGEFIDYFYTTHPRLLSARRQARYFLQFKKVDIVGCDIFIKQNNVLDHCHLLVLLNGDIKQCYLEN